VPPRRTGRPKILTSAKHSCARGLPIAEKASGGWIPEIRVTRPHNGRVICGTWRGDRASQGKRPRDPDRRANRVNFWTHLAELPRSTRPLWEQLAGDENAIRIRGRRRKTTRACGRWKLCGVKTGGGKQPPFGLYDAIPREGEPHRTGWRISTRWTRRQPMFLQRAHRRGRRAPDAAAGLDPEVVGPADLLPDADRGSQPERIA